jgi:hypothetical protein
LPPTSPAFAGLLFSTNEIVGKRRDPRLVGFVADFQLPC